MKDIQYRGWKEKIYTSNCWIVLCVVNFRLRRNMSYGHGSNNLELVSYCFNIIASLGRKRRERNFRLEFRIGCSGIFRAGYIQKQGGRKSEKQFESYSFAGGCHAAAVVFLLGFMTFVHLYLNLADKTENYLSQTYKVLVDKGQRASVILPDGTKVWLNSHTELTYNGDYGKGNRQVVLSGEGYFEVAKDSTSRFIVKAGEMEVEALGTTFNVKAYQEDRELTTTLFEGKVRTSIGKDEVILKPDESLSFDKSSRRMIVSDDLAAYARMWKDNELVFKGVTMEEVAVMLDRLYNVKVRFASEKVKRYRFSGVIKNNSLENVIELISLTAPIMYKKVGGEIIIEERK